MFRGEYKDGRPNGFGEMYYQNSIKSVAAGLHFELAYYKGNFRNGKREGKGKMVWQDGTSFEGIWKNDSRYKGRMIMDNGCVYIGRFVNDQANGPCEMLLMPSMVIYQGSFQEGSTSPVGMLLYPNGSIYYGQMNQFQRKGAGKLIELNGSFQEGFWEQDKLVGSACRTFDAETGELYSGGIQEGKRTGRARLYEKDGEQVYEGEFSMDRKQGAATLYKKNGDVVKASFRNNQMEGDFRKVGQMKAKERE